jgi:Holliday junction DNA helicase RuvA
VHTHVREDAITLYGFKTPAERETFLQLMTVKTVGPKVSLMALAGLSPEEIASAVRRNNPLALVVPGIGRKTAERIVQELRDTFQPVPAEAERGGAPLSAAAEEAVSALENMGCEPKVAARAVREVLESKRASAREGQSRGTEESFEALMKGALQWLREKRR